MKKKSKGKDKVSSKVAAAKAKIKAKVGKACVLLALLIAVAGCATSEPASRATTARYGDIIVKTVESTNVTVRITLGDGAIASADSSGSTETMTASPTNDVKPDIDVSVPVNKAGAAQSVGSVLGDAVASLISGQTKSSGTDTTAKAECTDGTCSE